MSTKKNEAAAARFSKHTHLSNPCIFCIYSMSMPIHLIHIYNICTHTHACQSESRIRKVSKLAKRHCWPKRQRIYSTFIRDLWVHQCVLCIFIQVISFNIIHFIVCRKTFRDKCGIAIENRRFNADARFENPLRPWKAPFISYSQALFIR